MAPALLDLPLDVVRLVLQPLGTRSLLNAASTCKTLKAMVDAMPLHPVMTSFTDMEDWLVLPHVAPRVRMLTCRNSAWGSCRFVRHLAAMHTLVVSFGRVTPALCAHLTPALEHLDVHRVDGVRGDIFRTSALTRLTRLHTLKMTFTPNIDLVLVDRLPRLRTLTLRLANAIVVCAPLAIERVHLHAVSSVTCAHPIAAEHLSLESGEWGISLDVMVTPATAGTLRTFSASCPHRLTVPSLEHMTRLEHLHVRYDSALLPLRDLAAIPTLATVRIDTRFGVAVSGMSAPLPAHVAVSATVAGAPMPSRELDALFFGKTRATTSNFYGACTGE